MIGEDCEFEQTGHLYLAYDEEEHAKLEGYAKVSESHGLAIERLGPADLTAALALAQRARCRGDLFGARRHRQSEARDARPWRAPPRGHGADIRENTRVTAIDRSGDGFALTFADGESFELRRPRQ